MALTAIYQRLPISGGDNNAYHIPVMQNMRRGSIGANSIDISNVAGALNVDLGFAGINDGTANGEGVLQITVGGTFSLAGSTAGAWHALEFSVSGTSCTFYLTALAAYTDESFMHADMKNYWSAAKLGYYRIASRRVLAFVFIRAGTVLGRIVNTENGVLGFKGIEIIDYVDASFVMSKKYIGKWELEIGDWNMDTTAAKAISENAFMGVKAIGKRIRNINVIIRNDADTLYQPLLKYVIAAGVFYVAGGIETTYDSVGSFQIRLLRVDSGLFDNASYSTTPYNRGWVIIEYET